MQDVEGWPLIQSFAVDSVCCPSGFFTARYKVTDISDRIDVSDCFVHIRYIITLIALKWCLVDCLPHCGRLLCGQCAAIDDQDNRAAHGPVPEGTGHVLGGTEKESHRGGRHWTAGGAVRVRFHGIRFCLLFRRFRLSSYLIFRTNSIKDAQRIKELLYFFVNYR